jgi:hypothetical protein
MRRTLIGTCVGAACGVLALAGFGAWAGHTHGVGVVGDALRIDGFFRAAARSSAATPRAALGDAQQDWQISGSGHSLRKFCRFS